MKIKDRPEFKSKPEPLTAKADDKVCHVIAAMVEQNYGSVVVVDEDRKVAGVLTERDIMKRLVHDNRSPDTTLVSDIMTKDPRVARADDNILDWLRIMSNERFRRIPIVDGNDQLISVMTQGDFVSYTWPDLIQQSKTLVKATVSSNYQILVIVSGIAVYSLALIYLLGQ